MRNCGSLAFFQVFSSVLLVQVQLLPPKCIHFNALDTEYQTKCHLKINSAKKFSLQFVHYTTFFLTRTSLWYVFIQSAPVARSV